MQCFSKFSLDERLLQALKKLKYQKPTPIQEQAIPAILDGKDITASASTGTGKTAAFLLPILQNLLSQGKEARKKNHPRALILSPTRELAMQIAKAAEDYSAFLPHCKTICLYGGVPYYKQEKQLSQLYDIVIATPGRLLDYLENEKLSLSSLQYLVLDEADRMLDLGFMEPVYQIANSSPKTRQTLLFSATFAPKILSLSKSLQKDPVEITIERSSSGIGKIDEHLYFADDLQHKTSLLVHLLKNTEIKQGIIFTSTIQSTRNLTDQLRDMGYQSASLHGEMNQHQRSKIVRSMHSGKIQFLVATDVASRGIDVPALSHIINLDLPFHAEDYIHRIGRTGRAGTSGTAITFAYYKEKKKLTAIEQLMGKTLSPSEIPGLEPSQKSYGSKRHKKHFSAYKTENFSFRGKQTHFKENSYKRHNTAGTRKNSFSLRNSDAPVANKSGRGSTKRDLPLQGKLYSKNKGNTRRRNHPF